MLYALFRIICIKYFLNISRATTEFTGWPSPPPPPTTPMPKTSSTSTTTEIPTTLPPTTPPTPSTTPPPPPISTTPGVCRELCELAGTIRLTSGAEWRPELLDHNTIEWQELADQLSEEVIYQNQVNLKV